MELPLHLVAAPASWSRDEERTARDLHTLSGRTYDTAMFDHIAASGKQHFDVGTQLTTYEVADPATGQPTGI